MLSSRPPSVCIPPWAGGDLPLRRSSLGQPPPSSSDFDTTGRVASLPRGPVPLDLLHKLLLPPVQVCHQLLLLLLSSPSPAQGSQQRGMRGCFYRWPQQRGLAIDGAPKRGALGERGQAARSHLCGPEASTNRSGRNSTITCSCTTGKSAIFSVISLAESCS